MRRASPQTRMLAVTNVDVLDRFEECLSIGDLVRDPAEYSLQGSRLAIQFLKRILRTRWPILDNCNEGKMQNASVARDETRETISCSNLWNDPLTVTVWPRRCCTHHRSRKQRPVAVERSRSYQGSALLCVLCPWWGRAWCQDASSPPSREPRVKSALPWHSVSPTVEVERIWSEFKGDIERGRGRFEISRSFARDDKYAGVQGSCGEARACDGIAGKIKSDKKRLTLVNIGRRTTGSTSDVTGVSSPIVILVTACVIARDTRLARIENPCDELFMRERLDDAPAYSSSCRTMAASWSAETRLAGAANIDAQRCIWIDRVVGLRSPPPIGKPPAPVRPSVFASAYRAVSATRETSYSPASPLVSINSHRWMRWRDFFHRSQMTTRFARFLSPRYSTLWNFHRRQLLVREK